MSDRFHNILVIQTAFIGDVVLTLPMIQLIRSHNPLATIDVVVVPRAAGLLKNHPAISNVIEFDKRGKDSGISGFRRLKTQIQANNYDLAVIPHRSLRSALLARLSAIPERVGFDRSAGKRFFTRTAQYNPAIHEIERNLSLLNALDVTSAERELPSLYPGDGERNAVDELLMSCGLLHSNNIVALAPGTVWNTKRWPKDRFAALAARLCSEGFRVVLVGGREDVALAHEICRMVTNSELCNAVGMLDLLASAELLRRCRVLISNDSAPMHLAVAVRTSVVAIFGATVPELGFAPYGPHDIVVETKGLSCRPCSIHGGDRCPIKTFDCMMKISSDDVYERVQQVVAGTV